MGNFCFSWVTTKMPLMQSSQTYHLKVASWNEISFWFFGLAPLIGAHHGNKLLMDQTGSKHIYVLCVEWVTSRISAENVAFFVYCMCMSNRILLNMVALVVKYQARSYKIRFPVSLTGIIFQKPSNCSSKMLIHCKALRSAASGIAYLTDVGF